MRVFNDQLKKALREALGINDSEQTGKNARKKTKPTISRDPQRTAHSSNTKRRPSLRTSSPTSQGMPTTGDKIVVRRTVSAQTPIPKPYRSAELAKSKETPIDSRAHIEVVSEKRFSPNTKFDEHRIGSIDYRLSTGRISTQIESDSDDEVQIVIGMDLGTSTTKVVIGDPTHNRFFAVPFNYDQGSIYLVPTAVLVDDHGRISITGSNNSAVRSQLKLDIMREPNDENILRLAGYVAQILRHSIQWFIAEYSDEYAGYKFFWTMSLGLPADIARQKTLEQPFYEAAVCGAQAALSSDNDINLPALTAILDLVKMDISNRVSDGCSSSFAELGSNEGVVTVVPEIAAQVVGLYNSNRWDDKNPITFLIDVGAGTVDSAVFSLIGDREDSDELRFSAITCAVQPLGTYNLHQRRCSWLLNNLPADIPETVAIHDYLTDIRKRGLTSVYLPNSIHEYVNSFRIVDGSDNRDADTTTRQELGNMLYGKVLNAARRKCEQDSAWRNLRVLICGGGSHSSFYCDRITAFSDSTAFKFRFTPLSKPENLVAPGLPESQYHRLSVAYGLAQGTTWSYVWPEEIPTIEYEKNEAQAVTKDEV